MVALNQRIVIASILVLVGLVSALALAGPMIIQHSSQITVTGSLEPGVEPGCIILHSNNGIQYLLTGWSSYPPAGTKVTITGYADTSVASYCMQGSSAIHVVSLTTQQPTTTTSFSISYGTGSATASSATVIGGSTQQSTSMTGVPITASGYVYTVVESPQCYPQCGAPSYFLTYLYIPPGTECTGMACYPPPQYYRLLNSDGSPFLANAPNGTYVTRLTGLLVTPSSWNCESFYVPKICMFGDVYVQSLDY